MSPAPRAALVLAAGLGTRMRPLTDAMPKPLLAVGGKPLIDHMLDRLLEGGVERAVVNVHYRADQIEAHLAGRACPKLLISDERAQLLETGGAMKKARALLGDASIFVGNTDSVWQSGGNAAAALAAAWNPAIMDVLLLVVPLGQTLGFDGPGDFFPEPEGRLRFRGEAASAPLAYMGLHITKPQIVDAVAEQSFSLARIWRQLAYEGRLRGCVFDGFWMHVGDPAALALAHQALLRARETPPSPNPP